MPSPKTVCSTVLLLAVLLLAACNRGGKLIAGEPAYVAAPQVNLRDRLSAVYNKTGMVKNGEKLEILERSKRFVRVRSPRGEEGWIEARYIVGPEVFDAFQTMQKENASVPLQARGVARSDLNMHVTPGRDTEHLYRMDGGTKVEVLKRVTAEKNVAAPKPAPKAAAPPPPPPKPAKDDKNVPPPPIPTPRVPPGALLKTVSDEIAKPVPPPPPPVLEDWLLVRDPQRRTGWVLARMVDIDVPLEIAQYAEGQRIMSAFVLNQVSDFDPDTNQEKKVAQYLVLATENKDGLPFDYNQLRVFTWNGRKHRYETAYRERNLNGFFPVLVGHEVFDKEGNLPYFVITVKDDAGNAIARKYKLNGPIVRRVLSAGEQQQEAAEKAARRAAAPSRAKASRRAKRRR